MRGREDADCVKKGNVSSWLLPGVLETGVLYLRHDLAINMLCDHIHFSGPALQEVLSTCSPQRLQLETGGVQLLKGARLESLCILSFTCKVSDTWPICESW